MIENQLRADQAKVELGHLANDLTFVTRSLRGRLRAGNASFYRDNDVAPGEVVLLNLIGMNAGLSQKQLAETVVLKKSQLTKAMNELEAAGLIERRKVDGDLRLNALYLTAKGEARRQELRAATMGLQSKFLAPLSAEEREALFTMLWKVVDHIAAGLDQD